MKRLAALAGLLLVLLTATPAHAATRFGTQLVASPSVAELTVAGDMVGVGSQPEIRMVVSANTDCGGPVTATATFPVVQGKTHYWVSLPGPCAGVAAVWTDVTVTEAISGVSTTIPGTFQWHE